MYSIYSCPVWVTEVVWLAGLRYKQKAVAQQTLPLCPKHRLENQLQRRDTSTLIELRQENVRTLGDMEITSDTCQFVAIQGLWKGTAKALLWDSCSQSVGVTDTGPWLSKRKSCHSYGCINTVWWNRLTATKSNTFAWKDIIGGYMDCFKVKWCQMQVQWCAMFDVKVMPNNKKPSNIVKQTNKVHAQWGPSHGPRLGWRYLYIRVQFTEMNTLCPKLLPRNQRGFFWILSLLIFVVFESTSQASMVGHIRAEGMTSGQSTHSIQIHPNPLWQGTLGDFQWFPLVRYVRFRAIQQSFSLCPQLVHGQIQIWGYRSWIILILAPESVHGFGLKVSLDEFDAVKIHTWQDWQENIFENKET